MFASSFGEELITEVKIWHTLNWSDIITLKIHTVTTFVIADIKTAIHAPFVDTNVYYYHHARFHMLVSKSS
jgi:hypothetical protein